MTQCTRTLFDFQALGSREVVAAFNGGKVISDAGGLRAPLIQQRLVSWAQFALGSIGTYVFLVHENTKMLGTREAK